MSSVLLALVMVTVAVMSMRDGLAQTHRALALALCALLFFSPLPLRPQRMHTHNRTPARMAVGTALGFQVLVQVRVLVSVLVLVVVWEGTAHSVRPLNPPTNWPHTHVLPQLCLLHTPQSTRMPPQPSLCQDRQPRQVLAPLSTPTVTPTVMAMVIVVLAHSRRCLTVTAAGPPPAQPRSAAPQPGPLLLARARAQAWVGAAVYAGLTRLSLGATMGMAALGMDTGRDRMTRRSLPLPPCQPLGSAAAAAVVAAAAAVGTCTRASTPPQPQPPSSVCARRCLCCPLPASAARSAGALLLPLPQRLQQRMLPPPQPELVVLVVRLGLGLGGRVALPQ